MYLNGRQNEEHDYPLKENNCTIGVGEFIVRIKNMYTDVIYKNMFRKIEIMPT